MLISTVIFSSIYCFFVSCIIKDVDIIIKIILAILLLAAVFIAIKGWINVLKK